MRKIVASIFSVALATVMLFSFAACFGSNTPEDTTPKEYIIQYTDDSGTHQLTVTAGMPYALDVVPTKNGYAFTGLYDSQVGGTQYISSSGASLSPFTDGKNMVLFPQFKANEYTLFLDYQGAQVTGSREYQVSYNNRLPELPKNLSLAHSNFIGWFTKPNAEGVQVADNFGLLSSTSYINEQNFDLTQDDKFIYLYAGFEGEKHTITCCFEEGMDTEEVQVPYNTSIGEVVPTTRVNGNAVLTWSKTQGGEVWNGKVTDDMVLYAVEYAPVIELDSSGGSNVNPVIARAGSTIALPTPTKDLAKFSHWEDMSGNKFTATTMPTSSTSLKAVWQAKLVFDENGGPDVDDISVTAGTKIILPTPEKDGFIFAGWYTADKEQYTSTTMPTAGVALKAGWYKEKTSTKVIIESNKYTTAYWYYDRKPSFNGNVNYTFNFNEFFAERKNYVVKIDYHAQLAVEGNNNYTVYLDFYSQKQISSNYLMCTESFNNITNNYREFNFTKTLTVNDDFYICWYADGCNGQNSEFMIKDFYYTVHYPDTTNLYL